MKKLASLLLCLVLMAGCLPASAAPQSFTLMIYLCGTDLESDGGSATADLREMIAAGVRESDDLTVYVQTGGTKSWQAQGLTDRKVERWRLTEEGIDRVESVGTADMGKADTFADFLAFGMESFPADRYGLVMWDHGSGSTGGLCYDEMTGNALYYNDIYSALESASKHDNYKKFSFIGFDACLMASYELALHLRPFADYMIASEELEPGGGWDYSAWLPSLANDAGMDMETLGKLIVDSFISGTLSYDSRDYATLSMCDLSQLDALEAAVEKMGTALNGELSNGNYATISRLRQNMRSFGEVSWDSASDMIDLTVFAEAFSRFDKDSASAIKAALEDVVVYEKHTSNLSNVTGLSILVPFATREGASIYMPPYTALNLSPDYCAFVSDMVENSYGSTEGLFAQTTVDQQSIQAAQIDWFSQYAGDESSYQSCAGDLWGEMYGSDYGDSNVSDFSLDSFLSTLFSSGDSSCEFNDDYDASSTSLWGDLGDDVDTSFTTDAGYGSGFWDGLGVVQQQDAATEAAVNVQTSTGESVTLDNPFAGTDSDYAYTVSLTQEQLEHLGKVEANLMMDISDPDFQCYVELGYVQDVVTDWNRGKIYGMFDGSWATLDGQMVCLYDQIANERYVRSLIPVTVNGEAYYLLVVFDEDNTDGSVTGYTEGYTEAGMPARNVKTLEQGDVVVPQYELLYWDENGEQQSEPFEGDPITVGADGTIPFGYEPVEGDAEYRYGFCLTDIYGEYSFTDFVTLSF